MSDLFSLVVKFVRKGSSDLRLLPGLSVSLLMRESVCYPVN